MRDLLLVVAIVVALAWYPVTCWIWPMRDCWCCKGTAHHRPDGNRKVSRPCRWCRQTGKRLRIGRRVANAIQRRRA